MVIFNLNICPTDFRQPQISGRTTVKEGDVLNLTCSADGFPPSVITWTKVETKTKEQRGTSSNSYSSTEKSIKGKNGNYSLSINMTKDDPGLYICTAKHLANNLQEEINITVTCEYGILDNFNK